MWNRFTLLIALPLHLLAQTSRVPFVGCPSIGQAGPVPAPKGADEKVQLEAGDAQRLAFYKASGNLSVLAPRGWQCFEDDGSSGGELFVTPDHTAGRHRGVAGSVVELDATDGGGSGTSQVSRVIARVFPTQWPLVKGLINAGDLPASEFRFGPYPKDKLLVQTDRLVQYRTPPRAEGLGTMSQLKANDDPIDGVAILEGQTPDLLMLRVRLPRELRDLAPVIIHDLLIRQRRDAR
jgi:hypothetical protein